MEVMQSTSPAAEGLFAIDHPSVIADLCSGRAEWRTLEELERLFGDFLDFQRLNKDSLIETGLRRTLFLPSRWLDAGLSNLYVTRLPAQVMWTTASEAAPSLAYKWWSGWPVHPGVHPSTSYQADASPETFSYHRLPDAGILPSWIQFTQLPKLTDDWKCSGRMAFLSKAEVERIEDERGMLFEIKESVLKEIHHALVRRDGSTLRPRCIDILVMRDVTAQTRQFYADVEERYRFLQGAPGTLQELALDRSPGGLLSLFSVLIQVEHALTDPYWDQYARLWQLLKTAVRQRGGVIETIDYSQLVEIVEALGTERAFDASYVLESIAEYFSTSVLACAAALNDLLATELRVDVKWPRWSLPATQAGRAESTLPGVLGTLTDFLVDPGGKMLCVLPKGLEIVPDDLEKLGFKHNSDYSRVEWWNGSLWEAFKFSGKEAREVIEKLFTNRAFDEANSVHQNRLRSSNRRMKDLFDANKAWKTMIRFDNRVKGQKGRYWLNSIPPVELMRK